MTTRSNLVKEIRRHLRENGVEVVKIKVRNVRQIHLAKAITIPSTIPEDPAKMNTDSS